MTSEKCRFMKISVSPKHTSPRSPRENSDAMRAVLMRPILHTPTSLIINCNLDNTMEYSYHHLIAAATLLLVAACDVLFSNSGTATIKLLSHGSSSKSSTLLRRMTELNNVDYEVVNNQNSNKDLVLPNVLLIGAQQSGTTSVSLC